MCVQRLAPIPAGKSQNVTNKSCYNCLRGVKNAQGYLMTSGVLGTFEPRMYPSSGYFLVVAKTGTYYNVDFAIHIRTSIEIDHYRLRIKVIYFV